MSDRTSRRLAACLAMMALAMEAASLVLLVLNSAVGSLETLGFNGVGGVILGLTYPGVGWLIASRRPQNSIGWIFLVVGLSQAGTAFVGQFATFGLVTRPGSVPLADVASWLGTWLWVPGFVLLFVLILVFPDGRLPSARWRPVLWLAVVAGLMVLIPSAVATWGYRGPTLLSDVPADAASDPVVAAAIAATNVGSLLILPVGLAAVAATVVRFRRSATTERQQIKWFAAAGVIEVSLLLVTSSGGPTYPFDVLAAVLIIPLVPIATAIAVLRYRLYEIDRLVSRTIGWTIVTGILGVVFVGVVIALETLLAGFTQGETLAVAASTLAAFALFQPLRRRVQAAVDRRFDRARYDGERVVRSFSDRLRNQLDLASLPIEVADVARETVRPATVAVWLRNVRSDSPAQIS
jgi:hypothetical protein